MEQIRLEMWIALKKSPTDALGPAVRTLLPNVLRKLPEAHRTVLAQLCFYLQRVAAHSMANRMTAESLATCIGPCVLRPSAQPMGTIEEAMKEMLALNVCMKILISDCSSLFANDLLGELGDVLLQEGPTDTEDSMTLPCIQDYVEIYCPSLNVAITGWGTHSDGYVEYPLSRAFNVTALDRTLAADPQNPNGRAGL